MPIKNFARFSREVKAFGPKVRDDALRLEKLLTLELFRRIVLKTPVRTGAARGNWRLSIGFPQESAFSLEQTDKVGIQTINRAKGILAGLSKFEDIFIVNNVPYIIFLEFGTSKMRPFAMVQNSILEIQAKFSSSIRDINNLPIASLAGFLI